MANFDNLKFRRQFLLSGKKCEEFKTWQTEEVASHYLYVHPDLELNCVKKDSLQAFLLGYAIDPYFPQKKNLDILENISNFNAIDEIPKLIHHLGGRFVLLIIFNGRFIIYNDACGLRSVFYIFDNNSLFAASQPKLLQFVLDIERSENYDEYYNSKYVKNNIEHWIPTGISLFDDVYHLVPNHYLDSEIKKQIRFWPVEPIGKLSVDYAAEKLSLLLKNSLHAANKRFKLALSLTAGYDSRIILSACKEIKDEIFIYTLQYRDLNLNSNDIKIPKNLAKHLGFEHHLIDCRKEIDEGFAFVYEQNTDIPHLNDWGKIAFGMYLDFPKDHVAIKGNCVEIGRWPYYTLISNDQITSSHLINKFLPNCKISFIHERLDEWYHEVEPLSYLGINFMNLFYWEQKLGSWQAQSQLEWDIVQEAFTPFNNREIISLMISVDKKYRLHSKYPLFMKMMNKLWDEVLYIPIDPQTSYMEIKKRIKDTLKLWGIDRLKFIKYVF